MNSDGDEYILFSPFEFAFSSIDILFFFKADEISSFKEVIVVVKISKKDNIELNLDSKEVYDSSFDLSLFLKSLIKVHKLLF